ncbi:MAG: zinc ABC transporter substrate-binding protein [Prevotella sp.]|nr:zinc ABC transporter substrate-binding protein [Prevotella sp.]MCM1075204.1 zinc ABC transporter substrate-binding protein [Ruminococcus sp.]
MSWRGFSLGLRVALLLCVLCGACSKETRNKVLTVSVPSQKWLLDSIVGDRYTVITMLGEDSNPETFEPGMRQLMYLQESDVFFTVGALSFEQTLMPKIQDNFPYLPIVNTSKGITTMEDQHAMSAHHDHTPEHEHSFDPHIWTSLPNARIMAKNMYEKVVELDPSGKDYYTTRYLDLDTRLSALNDSVALALAPLAGSSFVIWHPSLSYFARDYKLKQIGLETTGKETSVVQYRDRINRARRAGTSVFFTQTEFDTRQADALASELGIPTVKISLMQPDIAAQIRTLAHELTLARH